MSNIYDEHVQEALTNGGFYDDNNIWNSLVLKDGKLYRETVETLVLDTDDRIFIHLKDDDTYSIPGGGTIKNVDDMDQAKNKCMEKARIIVADLKYTGISYNFLYDKQPEWMQNYPIEWDGKYIHLYIGRYQGEFTGMINELDKDDDMSKYGKFYTYEDIQSILSNEHKYAYLKEMNLLNENNYGSYYRPWYDYDEMLELGVYNENAEDNYYKVKASKNNSKWFIEYAITNQTNFDWIRNLNEAYRNFSLDSTNENKQTLLELGWNPEIPVTMDTILKVSERKNNKDKETITSVNTDFLESTIHTANRYTDSYMTSEKDNVYNDRPIKNKRYDKDVDPEADDVEYIDTEEDEELNTDIK